MRLRNGLVTGLTALMIASPSFVNAQQACEALKDIKLDHATVVSAVSQDPAPLKQTPGIPYKVPDITVPRHCEVTGVARPTSDSEIDFTLWLPPREAWNGKYMQRGNGGWAGSIQPAVLVGPLARGYAVSATDDGHETKGIMPDATWAIVGATALTWAGGVLKPSDILHDSAIPG